MIRLLLLVLVVSCLFPACKSVKKMSNSSSVSSVVAAKTKSRDSTVVVAKETARQIDEEETKETIEQTFIPLDSAGLVIFKPVTILTRTTKSTRTADTNKNESEIKVVTVDFNTSQLSSSDTIAFNLEGEGIDPIESIASALFPTWIKILATTLILVPILWGLWLKRKNKPQ